MPLNIRGGSARHASVFHSLLVPRGHGHIKDKLESAFIKCKFSHGKILYITHIPPEYREAVFVGLDRLLAAMILRDIFFQVVPRHRKK